MHAGGHARDAPAGGDARPPPHRNLRVHAAGAPCMTRMLLSHGARPACRQQFRIVLPPVYTRIGSNKGKTNNSESFYLITKCLPQHFSASVHLWPWAPCPPQRYPTPALSHSCGADAGAWGGRKRLPGSPSPPCIGRCTLPSTMELHVCGGWLPTCITSLCICIAASASRILFITSKRDPENTPEYSQFPYLYGNHIHYLYRCSRRK